MAEEQPEDRGDYENPPAFFPYEEEVPLDEHPGDYGEPVEVQVEAVYMTQSNDDIQRFVVVSDGVRKLPILIGPFEATSITYALEGSHPDRPLTHDLFANVIRRLEGDVDRIVIDDLWGATYYAKIFITHGDEEIQIDSRPSDAIAIAVRFDAPIFVAEGILEQNQA